MTEYVKSGADRAGGIRNMTKMSEIHKNSIQSNNKKEDHESNYIKYLGS